MATMGIAAAQFILFLAGVGTLGFVGLALWFLLVR